MSVSRAPLPLASSRLSLGGVVFAWLKVGGGGGPGGGGGGMGMLMNSEDVSGHFNLRLLTISQKNSFPL